jgi:hypothetical protein
MEEKKEVGEEGQMIFVKRETKYFIFPFTLT